jgi:hypothetical protein
MTVKTLISICRLLGFDGLWEIFGSEVATILTKSNPCSRAFRNYVVSVVRQNRGNAPRKFYVNEGKTT